MIANRSVPTNTILPHVFYQNVAEAIPWLSEKFGFIEHYRYGDPASGAQLHLGDAWIMIASVRDDRAVPAQLGCATQSLTVFVDNIDAHYQRTQAAGVKIIEALHETIYGERQYGAEDLDGHRWLFSQHARDVSPDQWGARITNNHD
jgi:uncharacterized glyoxalase superfamily protein PhnB